MLKENVIDADQELEQLTQQYLSGDLSLDEYLEKTNELTERPGMKISFRRYIKMLREKRAKEQDESA